MFPRRFHLQFQYLLFERFLKALSKDYKADVILIRSNQTWKYRTLSGEWEESYGLIKQELEEILSDQSDTSVLNWDESE